MEVKRVRREKRGPGQRGREREEKKEIWGSLGDRAVGLEQSVSENSGLDGSRS